MKESRQSSVKQETAAVADCFEQTETSARPVPGDIEQGAANMSQR